MDALPPLFPLNAADYLGLGAATLGLILAAGGGIGGGGILVPIYILVLGFPVKYAIPLASVTVLGGAIANNLLNVGKSHPVKPSKFLIDWDVVLQLEPMAMFGTLVGTALIDWIPDLLLLLLLVLVLGATAHTTLAKARKLYETENKVSDEHPGLLGAATSANSYGGSDDVESDTIDIPEDPGTVRRHFIVSALQLTAFFVVVTLLIVLLAIDDDGELVFASCGAACYWIGECFLLALIFTFALWMRANLLWRVDEGESLSDIVWDDENTVRFPALATVAGVMAGLFGVGGGIVLGPLMLALGLHPAVASANTACMILYTSATACVNFSVLGYLAHDYAAVCIVLGFAATVFGQSIMSLLLRKYKRNSYIAFSIGIVVALSAVLMSIESVVALVT